MDSPIFIDGFGIQNYASFNRLQQIGPFKKLNIIIAQNNSGKSNILKFIRNCYHSFCEKTSRAINLESSEFHIQEDGSQNRLTSFSIGLHLDSPLFRKLLTEAPDFQTSLPKNELLKNFLLPLKNDIGSAVWLKVKHDGSFYPEIAERIFDSYERGSRDLNKLCSVFTNYSPGDDNSFKHHIIPEILRQIILRLPKKDITTVPCIRKIEKEPRTGQSADPNSYFDGTMLISRLAQLEQAHRSREKRQQFDKINQFVQEITGDENAKLAIPYERDTISVFMNNRWLSIENLGTGIQEVIILAATATTIQDQIVCIEEPELHLHPELQRKLIRYLNEKTNNQYFITTHSAHILDTPDAEIFHVKLENGASQVVRISDDLEKFSICKDLGYRASDLIQTNAVMWVEGPSDRIYLNHWLRYKAPELKEGLHYSIMFYGGRLLSHLSAQDHEIDDFISLHKLNQNMAILIDSDRDAEGKRINATKARIRAEFQNRSDLVWITEGREIENYLPSEILKSAIISVHGNVTLNKFTRFAKCLELKGRKGEVSPKKTDIARKVVESQPDFSILDLDKMVDKVVQFIKHSNHLD